MSKNIFSFDAESDGLYGDIFAIGAVILNPAGDIIDSFDGKAEVEAVQSDWVKENVIPQLDDMGEYSDRISLYQRFWDFWTYHRDRCICVGDFGAPVEALLMRTCVKLDEEARSFKGPYPMHELGTALFMAGLDPDIDRIEFSEIGRALKHNPLDDALVAGRCWLKVMRLMKDMVDVAAAVAISNDVRAVQQYQHDESARLMSHITRMRGINGFA